MKASLSPWLLGVVLLLVAGCTLTNPMVDAGGVMEELTGLEAAIAEEDWAAARRHLDAVRTEWVEVESWLAIHNNRSEMDRFAEGLRRLEIFINAGEGALVTAELVTMRRLWQNLIVI